MGALDLLALVFIPAVTAAGIAFLWQALFTSGKRFVLPIAIAVGFAAGCWLYPDRLPLVPERHWHWLPYAGLVAAVVGSLRLTRGSELSEAVPLYVFLAGMIAIFLVPTWKDLQPPRPVWCLLLAVYLGMIAGGLVLLPERLRGRGFIFLLMLAAAGSAVLVASEVSLRLGSVALRVITALGGCWAATWMFRSAATEDKSRWPLLTIGLIPVYAALTGGSMFVAAIDIPPTKYLLLFAPAAPLMLWLFVWGPLAKLQGLAGIVVQSLAVLAIPAALLAVSLLQAEPDEEWSGYPSTFSIVASGKYRCCGLSSSGAKPYLI